MDEAGLIAAARRGRTDAFNALVLAYQQQIYSYACRILHDPDSAADATQETFLSAYRTIGRFRGGSFRVYLLRIVTNACYDELRRRKIRPTTSFEELGTDEDAILLLVDETESPEEHAERRERERLVQAGIDTLPVDLRAVLLLRDGEGLSYEEIAAVAGVAVGTVRSRLARARRNLRDYLSARRELFALL